MKVVFLDLVLFMSLYLRRFRSFAGSDQYIKLSSTLSQNKSDKITK